MKKRLGIYIFNGAEIIDWAGPAGVFAVARRMDPELDVFLIGDSLVPAMTTANISINPRYGLDQRPDMDAFLIPGGIGTLTEMHNSRLIEFVKGLPEKTLLVSVCTGYKIFDKAGMLNCPRAVSCTHGDSVESVAPLERLDGNATKTIIERPRIVDRGRMIMAGGISTGLEMGFYLLERFGYDERFLDKIANVMECEQQWKLIKSDRLVL